MRVFQCYKCHHYSEVTFKNARNKAKGWGKYKHCECNCHEMKLVRNTQIGNTKGCDVITSGFSGSWDASEMNKKEIDKQLDRFFENPINRLVFERLGEIDGDGPIDWEYVKTGKRRNE